MIGAPDAVVGAAALPLFSQRIAHRSRLWWREGAQPLRNWRTYRDAAHWLREKRAYRSRDDPDEAWRCCGYWQRSVVNKWNGREFAARHGCAVPELYWRGRRAFARAALERAARRRHFVVRPVWGTSRRGVYVVTDGRELLRGQSASPGELHARMLGVRPASWAAPILVEEFVRSEDGRYRLPLEYKCYAFAGTVAAVLVIERTDIDKKHGAKERYYTPSWGSFPDPMNVALPQARSMDPPRCLEEMLRLAARMSAALGTYMRIDFFSTDRGCVLNEFSSAPGKGQDYTPYGDAFFGALWAEHCPNAT